jgi:hypothetical protein
MKEMLNWDLYTHPKQENLQKITPDPEKIRLAQAWKAFMDKENIYVSFYEWNSKTISKKILGN